MTPLRLPSANGRRIFKTIPQMSNRRGLLRFRHPQIGATLPCNGRGLPRGTAHAKLPAWDHAILPTLDQATLRTRAQKTPGICRNTRRTFRTTRATAGWVSRTPAEGARPNPTDGGLLGARRAEAGGCPNLFGRARAGGCPGLARPHPERVRAAAPVFLDRTGATKTRCGGHTRGC